MCITVSNEWGITDLNPQRMHIAHSWPVISVFSERSTIGSGEYRRWMLSYIYNYAYKNKEKNLIDFEIVIFYAGTTATGSVVFMYKMSTHC